MRLALRIGRRIAIFAVSLLGASLLIFVVTKAPFVTPGVRS